MRTITTIRTIVGPALIAAAIVVAAFILKPRRPDDAEQPKPAPPQYNLPTRESIEAQFKDAEVPPVTIVQIRYSANWKALRLDVVDAKGAKGLFEYYMNNGGVFELKTSSPKVPGPLTLFP